MVQTQIQLTEEQMEALGKLAKKRNIRLPDLIREGVDNLLRFSATPGNAERKKRAIAVAGRFSSRLGDLSKRHDDYLDEAFDS